MERTNSKAVRLLLACWKFVSTALFGPCCRYAPTCSEYAVEAVQVHGIFRGGFLAARRVCRCNSLFAGGIDPVPPKRDSDHNTEFTSISPNVI